MSTLLYLLTGVVGLVSLVCFVIVLIKLFQVKGVLHGILGIICSLYTFIWGWMKAGELKIKNVMLIWTGAMVISFILSFFVQAAAQ
jgi:hypothetical protein